MRAQHPDPNEPWPNEMVLTIEATNASAALLLFVRDAWGLDTGEMPALDPPALASDTVRPPGLDTVELVELWKHDWEQVWRQYEPHSTGVSEPDAQTQFLLDTLSDEELWEVMSTEPSRLWSEGLDEATFDQWTHLLEDDISLPVDATPERMSLNAVIEAWRRGLTHILEVPFAGYYAERISPSHLVVSIATRKDPVLYQRALREPLSS